MPVWLYALCTSNLQINILNTLFGGSPLHLENYEIAIVLTHYYVTIIADIALQWIQNYLPEIKQAVRNKPPQNMK